MNITAKQLAQASVVSVQGSIDALSAGEITQFMTAQVAGGQVRLVLDISRVDFMSSAGLRAILAALKACRQQGGDLRVAAAQSDVEKVLKMSGFTNILKTFATTDEAVASFGS